MPPTTGHPSDAVRRAGLFLAVAGVLWGLGGSSGKLLGAATGWGPVTVAAGRMLVGGGILLIACAVTGVRPPRGTAQWRRIAAVAGSIAVYQVAFFASVFLTTVSLSTLVTIGSVPVFVVLVQVLRGHERLHAGTVGIVALALVGLGLLVGVPSVPMAPSRLVAGTACALIAAAGFGTFTIIASEPAPGLAPLPTMAYGLVSGGVVVALGSLVLSGVPTAPGGAGVLWLAVIGLAATAVPYLFYFHGLALRPATHGAVFTLLEPLTGTLLAVAFLGERLSAFGIVGAVILFTAVVLVGRQE